jgi:hypothetical protein
MSGIRVCSLHPSQGTTYERAGAIATIAILALVGIACPLTGGFASSQGAEIASWVNVTNITGTNGITHVHTNSADETLLIGSKNAVSIWGIENQTRIRTLGGFTWGGFVDLDWNDRLGYYAWAHGGADSEEWDDTIIVFNLKLERIAAFTPNDEGEPPQPLSIELLQWRPGTDHLAIAFDDGLVRVYNVTSGEVLVENIFPLKIKQIDWSPHGTFLAVTIIDRVTNADIIHIIDMVNNVTWDTGRGTTWIEDIDWSLGGDWLFILRGSRVSKYVVSTREEEPFHDISGKDLASSTREKILAVMISNSLTFIDYEKQELTSVDTENLMEPVSGWSTDGTYFFAVDVDDIVRLWTRMIPRVKPSIEITLPIMDTTVSGILEVSGWSSSELGGVLSVQLKIGSANWIVVDGIEEWYYRFNTTTITDGVATIRARALDIGGFSDTFVVRVMIDNSGNLVNEPPIVWIDFPLFDSDVYGIVEVNGGASDDGGIVSVQTKIGLLPWRTVVIDEIGIDIQWSFYAYLFQETDEATIIVRAYDGNLFSLPVEVTFQVLRPSNGEPNDFHLEVLHPIAGITVPSDFTVYGVVTGIVPDASFIYFDYDYEQAIYIPGAGTWTYDFKDFSPGQYVMSVISRNGTYYSNWVTFNFYVDADMESQNHPPQVGIKQPKPSSTVSGDVKVTGWSSDDTGVDLVEIRVDGGPWMNATGTDDWSFDLDTSNVSSRWVLVEVRASDGVLVSSIDETTFKYDPVQNSGGDGTVLIFLGFIVLIIASVVAFEYIRFRRRTGE